MTGLFVAAVTFAIFIEFIIGCNTGSYTLTASAVATTAASSSSSLPLNNAALVLLQVLYCPLQLSLSNCGLFQLCHQTSDLGLQLCFTLLRCLAKFSEWRVFLLHCTIQLSIPSVNKHFTIFKHNRDDGITKCDGYAVGLAIKRSTVRHVAISLSLNGSGSVVHMRASVTRQYNLMMTATFCG